MTYVENFKSGWRKTRGKGGSLPAKFDVSDLVAPVVVRELKGDERKKGERETGD